jgi:hypothetical protein
MDSAPNAALSSQERGRNESVVAILARDLRQLMDSYGSA